MVNKKLFGVIMVGLVVLILSGQAQAFWGKEHKGREDRPKDPQKMQAMIADKLELTEEQKAKFAERGVAMHKTMEANRERMEDMTEKMKAEMEKDTPDRDLLHAYIREFGTIRTEMEIGRINSLLDLKEVLTEEQEEKFKAMMMKRKHNEERPSLDHE